MTRDELIEQWQPIETVPAGITEIIGTDGDRWYKCWWSSTSGSWQACGGSVNLIAWMPGPPLPKPQKKVIDLQPLIESGIDCEFSDSGYEWDWVISKLTSVVGDKNQFYKTDSQEGHESYSMCRPRMNHYHGWKGLKKCPLPDGFMVKIYGRDSEEFPITTEHYTDLVWHCSDGGDDIVGFEVLGVAEGYRMPWKEE